MSDRENGEGIEIRVTSQQVSPQPVTQLVDDLTGVPFPPHEDVVYVVGATFTDVDVTRQTFGWFMAIGAEFVGCRFVKTRFKAGSLGEVEGGSRQPRYVDCLFESVRIDSGMRAGNTRFERCVFEQSKIRGWRAFEAEFIDCRFTGELRDCWFTGTTDLAMYPTRERNEFRGNDFGGAELFACQFDYGINLAAQRFPTGPGYVILDRLHARIDRARAAISRWPNDGDREHALLGLRLMGDEKNLAGKDVTFVRRDDWLPATPHRRDEFFRLLEDEP